MTASAKAKSASSPKTGDSIVKDISLAAWGRNEIASPKPKCPG